MYHVGNLRQLLHRVAAIVVVGVFASLPTLARINDRLSTHDDVSTYRLSKNIERPHEKAGAAALVRTPPPPALRDDTRCGDARDFATHPPAPVVAPDFASRAPPVR